MIFARKGGGALGALALGTLALGTLLSTITSGAMGAQAASPPRTDGLPGWAANVGARQQPQGVRVFAAGDYGAVGDGATRDTRAIQRAIDACARAGGGVVRFRPGRYLTGALFVKSNVNLRVDAGVTLLGSQDDADYPLLPTRVAGIEMPWPAALINVNGQRNVQISGGGTIDGQGQRWWDKYRAMRRDYDARGLRWAADYDCRRVRLMVIWKSSDVTVRDVHLMRSGFWTVQIVYSDHVTADGVRVSDNAGPSTDGVDVDSSRDILVQGCDIDNNDDDICLKAGRDSDGLRVNRPTENVVVRDCVARHGGGIVSFGSETSGGIQHVVVYRDRGIGTSTGINFKSARRRGGFVRDVLVRDVQMENVRSPFVFTLNWNPSYSDATLPAGLKTVPPYWMTLTTPVTPPARGLAEFSDITIENVRIVGANQIFSATGLPDRPIHEVRITDVTAQGRQAGSVQYAQDWTLQNVHLETRGGQPMTITDSVRVDAPQVVPDAATGSRGF